MRPMIFCVWNDELLSKKRKSNIYGDASGLLYWRRYIKFHQVLEKFWRNTKPHLTFMPLCISLYHGGNLPTVKMSTCCGWWVFASVLCSDKCCGVAHILTWKLAYAKECRWDTSWNGPLIVKRKQNIWNFPYSLRNYWF